MREDTIWRKKANRLFQKIRGSAWPVEPAREIISEGKRGLDGLVLELGRMVAEAVMYMEREEVVGFRGRNTNFTITFRLGLRFFSYSDHVRSISQ